MRADNGEENAKIAFSIPFISDEFSADIRRCVQKADLQDTVRIVGVPPANLRKQLVRNRLYDRMCTMPSCVVCPFGREGDCMSSGVVYLITCQRCKEEYIGETGRPLSYYYHYERTFGWPQEGHHVCTVG